MAQHDYDINSADAISGLQFRQDVNACLSAIKSTNSGATAPSSTVSGMLWLDTSTTPNVLKVRNTANDGWIAIPIESVTQTVASAATTSIGGYGQGDIVTVTGTNTITSLGTSTTGSTKTVIFSGSLTLTHNATSLILQGNSSITTTAGDSAVFTCIDGALGYWKCLSYIRLSSHPVQQDSSTGAMYMPYGTTAQRPSSPNTGYMRFNTDLGKAEVWNGSVWSGVGGGATGGGSDTVFVETSYAVTQNYTITAGKSAITVGDANGNVSIADGISVTVPDASIWLVQGV